MQTLTRYTDFLIIGSGISGLYSALLLAAEGSVVIITKGRRDQAATAYAQGGIAAAVGEDDKPVNHFEDTIRAGAGLCDPVAVELLVNEGVDRVNQLISSGMQFTRNQQGKLDLGLEGGHGHHRVLHVSDHTGRDMEDFLLQQVRQNSNITVLEHHMAIDLLTEHHLVRPLVYRPETCYGAYILEEQTGIIYTYLAGYIMLATGGAGRVYPFTTNPDVNTGDGIAMAYHAGCRVRNLEFIQFHPTALCIPSDPAFLISEAVRGFGARLVNKKGEPFMKNYDPRAELAPRDIVARAIDSELKKSGDECVYLDISHQPADEIKKHFPLIYQTLLEKFKLDMCREPIPVVPAAHYTCGGVLTDYEGRTDLEFLYAVGETASSGVHGANRLASNSLLEGLVFGYRASQHMLQQKRSGADSSKKEAAAKILPWNKDLAENLDEWILVQHDLSEIRSLMWDYVGIVRSTVKLERALRRIDIIIEEIREFYNRTIPRREIVELRNIARIAQLICRSALARRESRGLHCMTEYPENRLPSRSDTVLEPSIYKLPKRTAGQ